jgi:hypothetical protein
MRWPFARTVSEDAAPVTQVDELSTRLREEQESNLLLTEQLVELTARDCRR